MKEKRFSSEFACIAFWVGLPDWMGATMDKDRTPGQPYVVRWQERVVEIDREDAQ